MVDVRRILCPIDFSDTARVAMRWGVELGRLYGARLTLLHVYHTPAFTMPEGVVVGGAELLGDVIRQVEDSMAQWRAEAEAMGAPSPEVVTVMGATHPEITRYARENGFDLIVIGTHGRT